MSWRYIAQRISGPSKGAFLDWNLPLVDVEITDNIGAGWLSAKIDPEFPIPMASDGHSVLDKWSTAIWAEEDGLIRGGGILVGNEFSGPTRDISCMGYAGYPNGMPYEAEYPGRDVDPMDMVRHIWAHVQRFPGSDLDMVIDATVSPIKLRTYNLYWWEAPDCGDSINSLATSTPFEYREVHSWSQITPGKIDHRLQLGYPRVGSRRTDLRFMLGENITPMPPISDDGAEYANAIYGLGRGTGRSIVTGGATMSHQRLRRVRVLSDNTASTTAEMNTRSKTLLDKISRTLSISSIVVDDHPNAKIGSWQPGDEILVQGHSGWVDVALWCRVLTTKIRPEDGNKAELTLEVLPS